MLARAAAPLRPRGRGPRDARAPFARGRLLIAVLAWLVLAVVVPVTFVDWSRGGTSVVTIVLGLLVVGISAARLAETLAFDRPEMVRSMFYVFVYVFLAVPALAQSVSGRFPLDELTYDSSTEASGLLHILAGVIAYEVGWRLRPRRVEGTGERTAPRFSFAPRSCVVVGALGVGVASYRVAEAGLAAFFTSRATTTAALTGTQGERIPYYMTEHKAGGLLMIFLSQVLVFVALFAILYARHHRLWPGATPRLELAWQAFIAALVAANVVMNNPMGNSRFWFGIVIIGFLSIYVRFDRPNSQRIYVGVALLVLFFVFASLDVFRVPSSSLDVSGPGSTFVRDGTYGMFQMELQTIRFVEAEGHGQGRQMAGYVLNFVPRQLWADKPLPTGQMIEFPLARSTTVWSEWYSDFGLLGVVVLFVIYGSMSRRLTDRSRSVGPGLLHATLPILAAFQLLLLRGSLLPVMGVLYQLVFVFGCLLTTHPPRRPGVAQGPQPPDRISDPERSPPQNADR